MKKSIVLCNKEIQKILQVVYSPEQVAILKWYYTDRVETEWNMLANEIISDGYVGEDIYVFVAVTVYRRRMFIWNMLRQMGFQESHIINLYQFYWLGGSQFRYRNIMNQELLMEPERTLDGLVLGISHGMTGIDAKRLPGHACNLCCSSQDIYFNYKTLTALMEDYWDQIKELKYVVMELFDYTYFNYDTIQAGECETYLEKSGFCCEERAGMEDLGYVDQLNHWLSEFWAEGKSNVEKKSIVEATFPKLNITDCNCYQMCGIDLVDMETVLEQSSIQKYKENPTFTSIQLRVYDETIQFQFQNFIKILNTLERINPKIKIYGVLLPKYYIVEQTEAEINAVWKKTFLKFMDLAMEQHGNFAFFDLKGVPFVKGREYWRDLSHLNRAGATLITDYIRESVMGIEGAKIKGGVRS